MAACQGAWRAGLGSAELFLLWLPTPSLHQVRAPGTENPDQTGSQEESLKPSFSPWTSYVSLSPLPILRCSSAPDSVSTF